MSATGPGAGPGYHPSPWPAEDGGPRRLQQPHGLPGPDLRPGDASVASRDVPAATMVVLRDPGEVFLLRHTAGEDAVSWVERIHPERLDEESRSPDLPGGPTWPGGLAAHANGSLYVVFGEHAHRLDADLAPVCSTRLPRHRPYNSFVVLPDGCIVTKDFGGARPGAAAPDPSEGCEVLVLEPERLEVVGSARLPEPSVARLSADGDDVLVVGTSTLFRLHWDGVRLVADEVWRPRYRTLPGQTYGWDPVIEAGAAWFLDDGEGSEAYSGTLRGHGVSVAPLHVVRVDLSSGAVALTEVSGLEGGLVANPPLVDARRGIVVGFDSGNGVLAAFDLSAGGGLRRRWSRAQDHACHLLLFADTGELLTTDHDAGAMAEDVVVLDVSTGEERLRVPSGGPLQSVLFGAPGWDRDLYLCSFSTLTRVAAA